MEEEVAGEGRRRGDWSKEGQGEGRRNKRVGGKEKR